VRKPAGPELRTRGARKGGRKKRRSLRIIVPGRDLGAGFMEALQGSL
jgi:hypothetical protein